MMELLGVIGGGGFVILIFVVIIIADQIMFRDKKEK
jgi:hypothetical protein